MRFTRGELESARTEGTEDREKDTEGRKEENLYIHCVRSVSAQRDIPVQGLSDTEFLIGTK